MCLFPEVWIIEPQQRVDYDVSPTFKWRHAAWVKEFGINVLSLCEALEVVEKGVRVRDEKGKERVIEADTVVLAGPRRSLQDLNTSLEFIGDEVYTVGDAVTPRSMNNAIHEGYKLGARI